MDSEPQLSTIFATPTEMAQFLADFATIPAIKRRLVAELAHIAADPPIKYARIVMLCPEYHADEPVHILGSAPPAAAVPVFYARQGDEVKVKRGD